MEKYELNFKGKNHAKELCTSKSTSTFISDNIDSENVYISGDNLDALKYLLKDYSNKIKCIYIDPPYNTHKNFIYNDSFKNGNDIHSEWLSMMYPRLFLSNELLSDDGVIFISIDDNEYSNLKLICDEIFGESNFVCTLIWNTKSGAQGIVTKRMIVPSHEYILVYAKKDFKFLGIQRELKDFIDDNDPRGLWKRQYLQRKGQGFSVKSIKDPKTGNVFSFETPYTQDKLNKWIEEDRIIFPTDVNKYPARKEFLSEYKYLQQLVTYLGTYVTKTSTENLYKLFDGCKVFIK